MTRAALVTSALALIATCLASSARAETGYVFKGDINHDGVEDRIESGPAEMIGNGGGPFVVTLGAKKGPPKKFALGLSLMVTVENTREGVRIWTYWRSSLEEGTLFVYTLTDKVTEERITMHPGETDLGKAVYDLVFAKGRSLEFKAVENYKPPPNPDGVEWGK